MQIIAQPRKELGKKTKKVRREKRIPAVVFGPDIDSIPLSVGYKEFVDTYIEAGETSLVDLAVEGEKEPFKVLISDVQLNPVNNSVLHTRFFKVNLKEKTEVDVPVVIEGEESIPLVKTKEALVLTQLSEITVSALPADLPKEFVVDVSGLVEIGDSIKVSDLQYDREKVEIVAQEEDAIVAILDYAQSEEAEEDEEVSEEELVAGVEATGEKGASEDSEKEDSTAAE
ncbi:50S ribosomal protein L25 [Patescibacteria group bacterium]|nr:50S ribosomal protein L25 [Patescibacteria group bacterium]HOM77725.1 50S ribosomal protein L25 [bacterium]